MAFIASLIMLAVAAEGTRVTVNAGTIEIDADGVHAGARGLSGALMADSVARFVDALGGGDEAGAMSVGWSRVRCG